MAGITRIFFGGTEEMTDLGLSWGRECTITWTDPIVGLVAKNKLMNLRCIFKYVIRVDLAWMASERTEALPAGLNSHGIEVNRRRYFVVET